MAGIYIHIPFCKQACHYCDFHFSTKLSYQADMVAALLIELTKRKDYLGNETIQTIYFGGGTPSLLTNDEITLILDKITALFKVDNQAEITLEANPDDLSPFKLKALQTAGINRLSIGIQCFDDQQLLQMNRAHRADEAVSAVKSAQDIGLENISIDLMYGLPDSTLKSWENTLIKAISLQAPHISAYCLTIEPQTFFGHLEAQSKLDLPSEEIIARQYEIMVDTLKQHNYIHYEVSNFCLPGKFAVHNSNYWKRQKYLGIGPSAHSYNLTSRQFNVKNNHHYLQRIANDHIPFEKEDLTRLDQANDYLLTSLRTIWGCNLSVLKENFKVDLVDKFQQKIATYFQEGLLTQNEDTITLTEAGMLLADQITSELFLTK